MDQQLSNNDRTMIGLLLRTPEMTVGELVEAMGVTATAVRQRLSRLMALGIVTRSHTVEGRGRPSHHYALSEKGRSSLANNLGDLAVALWQSIQEIDDLAIRRQIISNAVKRLAKKYEHAIQGATTEDRMEAISQLFSDRQIPLRYEKGEGLPLIRVAGCPYPNLANDNDDICNLEKELLSTIIGQPIDRCECQHDGDACCSFQASESLSQS